MIENLCGKYNSILSLKNSIVNPEKLDYFFRELLQYLFGYLDLDYIYEK